MGKWRVLAIDDDVDLLELIEMTLGESYEVASTASGLDAIEVIEIFEPDLIILDIMMPKITGYQIIEILKKRNETAHIPVMFLSAKDTIRDQRYGYKLGATTYLTKPFQPDRLLRNISSIFQDTPPERRAKKWTAAGARERIKALGEGGDVEEPKDDTPPLGSKTVHHREAETTEDKRWQG